MWDNVLTKRIKHKLGRGQILLRHCPYCGDENYNIEVSVEKEIFHCWICDAAGIVKKLFMELGLPFEDDGMKVTPAPTTPKDELTLKPFRKVRWENYAKFLKSRGLEKADIDRYNIMTTDKGKFKNKIIFPLYEDDKLVYLVARDVTPKGKYYNINISRSGVLPYFPGTKKKTEAYLCEGVMDAISVNKLGYPAVVLLGTILSAEQLRKFAVIGFKDLVVCLDGDVIKKAIQIYDKISKAGFKVTMASFSNKDDPNSLFVKDRAELKYILKQATEVTLTDRVKLHIK
jgi:DNA primase